MLCSYSLLACQLPAAVAEEQARQAMACSLESLIARYHLTEEDVSKRITYEHIEVISSSTSLCSQWKSLPAHLGLTIVNTIVGDIDSTLVTETEKKRDFFTTWKEEQGCNATYRKLIGSLLEVPCKQDAESVCQLLKSTNPVQPQQQQKRNTSAASLGTRSTLSGK